MNLQYVNFLSKLWMMKNANRIKFSRRNLAGNQVSARAKNCIHSVSPVKCIFHAIILCFPVVCFSKHISVDRQRHKIRWVPGYCFKVEKHDTKTNMSKIAARAINVSSSLWFKFQNSTTDTKLYFHNKLLTLKLLLETFDDILLHLPFTELKHVPALDSATLAWAVDNSRGANRLPHIRGHRWGNSFCYCHTGPIRQFYLCDLPFS